MWVYNAEIFCVSFFFLQSCITGSLGREGNQTSFFGAYQPFQSGPKGTKMVNLSVFDHKGPLWAHLYSFGPFQTRIDFLLPSTSTKPCFVHFGQKNHFCLKWPKRVQMGSKGVPNGQKHLGFPFGPIWTTWSVEKPAMFGVDIKLCHWVPKVPFLHEM